MLRVRKARARRQSLRLLNPERAIARDLPRSPVRATARDVRIDRVTHRGKTRNLVTQPLGRDDGDLIRDALVRREIKRETRVILLDDLARGLRDANACARASVVAFSPARPIPRRSTPPVQSHPRRPTRVDDPHDVVVQSRVSQITHLLHRLRANPSLRVAIARRASRSVPRISPHRLPRRRARYHARAPSSRVAQRPRPRRRRSPRATRCRVYITSPHTGGVTSRIHDRGRVNNPRSHLNLINLNTQSVVIAMVIQEMISIVKSPSMCGEGDSNHLVSGGDLEGDSDFTQPR